MSLGNSVLGAASSSPHQLWRRKMRHLIRRGDGGRRRCKGFITTTADEAVIRENAEKYVEAYNRRDSKTMASMWSPEAVYMDPATNEGVVGREAISKVFDEQFAGSEDSKLAVTIDSIDFVSPNVAIEKGQSRDYVFQVPDGEIGIHGRQREARRQMVPRSSFGI